MAVITTSGSRFSVNGVTYANQKGWTIEYEVDAVTQANSSSAQYEISAQTLKRATFTLRMDSDSGRVPTAFVTNATLTNLRLIPDSGSPSIYHDFPSAIVTGISNEASVESPTFSILEVSGRNNGPFTLATV